MASLSKKPQGVGYGIGLALALFAMQGTFASFKFQGNVNENHCIEAASLVWNLSKTLDCGADHSTTDFSWWIIICIVNFIFWKLTRHLWHFPVATATGLFARTGVCTSFTWCAAEFIQILPGYWGYYKEISTTFKTCSAWPQCRQDHQYDLFRHHKNWMVCCRRTCVWYPSMSLLNFSFPLSGCGPRQSRHVVVTFFFFVSQANGRCPMQIAIGGALLINNVSRPLLITVFELHFGFS